MKQGMVSVNLEDVSKRSEEVKRILNEGQSICLTSRAEPDELKHMAIGIVVPPALYEQAREAIDRLAAEAKTEKPMCRAILQFSTQSTDEPVLVTLIVGKAVMLLTPKEAEVAFAKRHIRLVAIRAFRYPLRLAVDVSLEWLQELLAVATNKE